MKIYIRFLSEDDFELNLVSNKIVDIKELIANEKNTSIKNIKLIFMGKILKNEDLIEEYKIIEGSKLHCVIKKSEQNTENNNTPENGTTSQPTNSPYNSQMRELIINLTLQNLNLPSDSPMRHVLNQVLESDGFSNLTPSSDFLNNINSTEQINFQDYYNNFLNNSNQQMFSNLFNTYQNSINSNQNNSTNTEQNTTVDNQTSEEITDNVFNNCENLTTVTIPDNVTQINNLNLDEVEENTNDEIEEVIDIERIEELKNKYSEELENIRAMGFNDDSKILDLLDESHGSVSIALNKLFND